MKKAIIFSGALLVLVIGTWLYFKYRKSTDFEPLLKAKLQQIVKDGSDGLYTLQMDKIDVDVIKSKIIVLNAELFIDSARLQQLVQQKQAPNDVYKISFKSLSVDGIGAADILNTKNIDLSSLSLNDPVVEIFHHKRDYNYIPDTISLYRRIAKEVEHFKLDDLLIKNINFTYHNITQKDRITKFENVSLHLMQIDIDSLTQYDSTRFLYAEDAVFFLRNYSLKTPDSLYTFMVDSLALQASKGIMNLKGLSLKPRGKKEDFSQKLKFYKDRYDIKIDNAIIKNIDWYHLLSEDGFTASEAVLNNGEVEIFADRSLPPPGKNKVGNYPHQLLMKLNFPVELSKIDINDFKVSYKEYNPKSKKTGTLIFDKINGSLTNVTNKEEQIAKNKIFELDADSRLMNNGSMHVSFMFDLSQAKDGVFALDVNLKNMNGAQLNSIAVPVGLFEINNAQINSIKVHLNAGNYKSKATVLFLYDDLKITLLKPDEDEPGKIKQKGFLSFLANTLILKKSNPGKGKNASEQIVTIKRDPYKSFFNLIWITIREGLMQTAKGN